MSARFDNIQRMSEALSKSSSISPAEAQKAAFATETNAYNTALSKEAYEATINAFASKIQEVGDEMPLDMEPNHPGIEIGSYQNCYYIADGFTSQVYRSGSLVLKVITENREMEPHNPTREVKILKELSHPNIIKIVDSFIDTNSRLALVFNFMPLTLANLIESGQVTETAMRPFFRTLFEALAYLHDQGIIHRDIKPSNILLASKSGPAYLADFGTAWHPLMSALDEHPHHKALEVGSTCYRAPETLFGNRSYGCSLDMWAAGTVFAECCRQPPKSLFESRDAFEDGNQLSLILSVFKTIGTPTVERWPEAVHFTTPPFQWYKEFPGTSFVDLLPDASDDARDLVGQLVVYESGRRLTAKQALEHPYFQKAPSRNSAALPLPPRNTPSSLHRFN